MTKEEVDVERYYRLLEENKNLKKEYRKLENENVFLRKQLVEIIECCEQASKCF